MYYEGKSIKQIAKARNLTETTIESHFIKLYETKVISSLEAFIPKTQLKKIINAMPKDFKELTLSELMEKTNKKFSYFELKAVRIME